MTDKLEWPEGVKPAMFSEIAGPIRKAFRFGYSMQRKNKGLSVPWTGLDGGIEGRSSCLEPAEALTKDSLEFNLDDQRRDLLDVLIGIAVGLGIEQGRRITLKKMEEKLSLLKISSEAVHFGLSELCHKSD